MLVGRAQELGHLQALLDDARRGRSAALIVHGEPGIGKTSLLDAAASGAPDFLVLRAQPLQAESELPFAGLADLFRPILRTRERLPARQREALDGALALGPAVAGDRFAVAAATLSLLAAAAEDAPVLAVVDDAHWLDAPSRLALIFAARRLVSEGVVLVLAMRDRDWLTEAGLTTVRLAGLAAADAAVLADAADGALDSAVRQRVVSETDGNPLAILEAVAMLSGDERRGTAPIARPLAVGPLLASAFAQQLDGLPSGTRRALLVAAASDTGAAAEVLAALAGMGLSGADLEAAERTGVIAVTAERIAFRHPLVRSAAYHAHDPAVRREAHRALATALGGGDRGAWHLAAAALGPDEEAARGLEEAGASALSRTAYAAAARALEAAAVLSPRDGDRLRRTVGAGRALWLGGDPARAAALLEQAVVLAPDPATRAQVQQLRGATMFFTCPVSDTFAMLVAEAERVQPHDRRLAAGMLCTASNVSVMGGELYRAEEIARRAVTLAEEHPEAAGPMVDLTHGAVLGIRGQVAEGLRVIERVFAATARETLLDPGSELASAVFAVVPVLTWTERWELARPMLEGIIAAARSAGAPTGLPFWLAALSELELRSGRIAAAYAAASESVALARDTGQVVELPYSLVTLARVLAVLGYDDDCRSLVSSALTSARRTGAGSISVYSASVLGLLELGRGRPELALGHLGECARLRVAHGLGLLAVVQWAGDLFEAQLRADEPEAARETLAMVEANASQTGVRWERAIAARGRAMLAGDGAYESQFEQALELHGEDSQFERARTLLGLGQRRRRARRRADARAALREALAYFETAGAEPWAEQARSELRAAGESSSPTPGRHSLRSLTPQELQVAMTVAGGATNKEAAASLFLSTKTVEFHLTNAYRKLGVRSRAELVRRVEGLS